MCWDSSRARAKGVYPKEDAEGRKYEHICNATCAIKSHVRLDTTSEIPREVPNPKITGDMISSPSPVVVRRTSRNNARVPPNRYGFSHDIAQFISYSVIRLCHLPKYWQVAKEDPKWKAAMHEELKALEKNKTWEIVALPQRKEAVGANGCLQ